MENPRGRRIGIGRDGGEGGGGSYYGCMGRKIERLGKLRR